MARDGESGQHDYSFTRLRRGPEGHVANKVSNGQFMGGLSDALNRFGLYLRIV